MTQFNVTPENWNDGDFWAAMRGLGDDGGLSFSALSGLFKVTFLGFGSAVGARAVITDGENTFTVGPQDAADVDAHLGEDILFEDFAVFETSKDGASIEGVADAQIERISSPQPEEDPEQAPAADSNTVAQDEPATDTTSAEGEDTASDLTGGDVADSAEVGPTLISSPLAGPTDRDVAGPNTVNTDVAEPEAAIKVVADATGKQVVVIDSGIEDAEELAASFGPDVQVVFIDPNSDGVEQIAAALEGQTDITGLHILAHGAEGHLSLGDSLLDAGSIAGEHAAALAAIGATLSEDGDILIYGCNFGAGETGEEAMLALAEATMGDIAASDDLTGAAELGGDWELEEAQGTIETEALEIEGWNHVMSNYYGTSGSDSLMDSYGNYSYVYGYGSADTLLIGSGTVYGGDGNDAIGVNFGGQLYGGSGDDALWGLSSSVIDGGTGSDTLITSNGSYDITLDLNETGYQTYASGNTAIITGIENLITGSGDDELQGNDSANNFNSGGGQDTLSGGKGDDTLDAGWGNDTIVGGSGQDSLLGGDGADSIRGDTEWLNPSDYASGSGSSTSLTINNDSGETIKIYWISGSGTLSHYGTISDGGTYYTSTYTNHNWLIKDANGVYRQVIEVNGTTVVNYDGADLGDTIDGGAGSDTIRGESGDDLIDGGTGADSIYGGVGDDTIAISDSFGNDTIYGEDGSGDKLDASAVTTGVTVTFTDGEDGTLTDGSDTLSFDNIEEFELTGYDDSVDGSAADKDMYVQGGAGDDTITGGSDDDTLEGGDDDDVLSGGAGDDSLIGGAGNDSLIAGNNSGAGDTLEGGSGSDTLVDSYWNATLDGGDDADLFKLGYGDATVTGGEGGTDADTISFVDANDAVDVQLSGGAEAGTYTDSDGDTGTFTEIEAFELSNQDDTFSSNGVTGAESVYGMSGDDTISTQGGDDYVEGGSGADSISAGQGADTVYGGVGDDYIDGQSQDDLLYGGDGEDTILGGQHNDTIDGGSDNDYIDGQTEDDSLMGGAGDDTILGGTGSDTLQGGSENDSLDGQADDDSLSGGSGADTLIGGLGSDTLTGGTGEDVFQATSGDGRDTITDFDIADDDSNGFFNDQLDVSGLSGGTGPAGAIRAFDVSVTDDGSGNAILTFPGGESLLLQGVAPASISGGPNLYAAGIPCFTPNVRISTARGLVPAGEIREGDFVQTADNGWQPVIWVGQRALSAMDLKAHPHLCPVLLQPNSMFGNDRAVMVSPQHRFRLPQALTGAEEAFLRAKLLPGLPLSGVRRARGVQQVTYVHLMTPRHEVIFAEGLATETFYPGPDALKALSAHDRRELSLLFPDLLQTYGDLARRDLRRCDLREKGLLVG